MQAFRPIRPKKRLGQHFLHDEIIAQKIVKTLTGHDCSAIVEIGPGTGALTRWLVDYVKKPLYLIEVDPELVIGLHQAYPRLKDHIITADFLQYSLQNICTEPIALIGNFPYNISSSIFFKILANHNQVQEVVCMLQKEVAERIYAPAGSKTYGILSVLLQTFYNISYCFTVPASAFIPKPKVTSALIHLQRNTTTDLPCDESYFVTVVKAAFSQRRKMLRNALRSLGKPLEHIPDTVLKKRAEQLTSSDFIKLAQALEKL